ncbi:MAG: IclR family transcriptional regulator [Phycisphaerae bacterium]|nr:IclR family transcriptional regulator [Phycisphaerae bacterium]
MIQVIHRGLDILELLASQPERVFPLGEIAQVLDLHRATCSNILKTLSQRGYVERLPSRGGYRLGSLSSPWQGLAEHDHELSVAARPVLQSLSQTLNETSLIGVIRGGKRVMLECAAGDRDLQVRSRRFRNVYETASGRLLLAYLPDEQRNAFVERVGLPDARVWREIRSAKDLNDALAAVRRRKLARSDSPEHVVGLAVPVWREDQVVASISVYLPEVRLAPRRRNEIVSALRGAGAEISRRLASKPDLAKDTSRERWSGPQR